MGFSFGNAIAAVEDIHVRACLMRLGKEIHASSSTLSTVVRNAVPVTTYALASVNLTAGNGLTGGGDLSANRSFTVTSAFGLTVTADDTSVNQAMVPTWTGIHTFSAQDVHNAGVSLGTSGTLTSAVTDTGTNSGITYQPSVPYTSGQFIHHFKNSAGVTGLVQKADETWEFGGTASTGGYIGIRGSIVGPYGILFAPTGISSTTTIGGVATAVSGSAFVVPQISSVNTFGGEFRASSGSTLTSTDNWAAIFNSVKGGGSTMTRFGLMYLTDVSTNAKGTLTDWIAIYGASIGTLPLAANRAWINLNDLTKASVTGTQNSILLLQANTGYKALAFKDQNAWINCDTSGVLQLNATTSVKCAADFDLSTKNIIGSTTTGTKIMANTTHLLGFWNAPPIAQPTTAVTAATFVANTSLIFDDSATFDGYTIGKVVKALRNAGILA